MKHWLLAAMGAALCVPLASSCSVEEIELEGKDCPCADGWECNTTTNKCFQPGSAGTGGTGGAGGSGGSGASGGTGGGGKGGTGAAGGVGATGGTGAVGGTGGCTSVQKLCAGQCVTKDDPLKGCAATACDPCPAGTNSMPACSAGACSITCAQGFGDCDKNPTTGCEIAIAASDPTNCGACNRTCSTANTSGTSCDVTTCKPVCVAGFADCNASSSPNPDDGCEADLSTSSTSCGSCSNSCATQGGVTQKFGCFSGFCGCSANAQCQAENAVQQAACNATLKVCVCGSTTCNKGETCVKAGGTSNCACNGKPACSAGQVCCPVAGCVDVQTSAAHCGACGNACPTGQTCVAGLCT